MFNKVIGHDTIKEYFEKILLSGNMPHSYIFQGQAGVGKMTMARAIAKNLICSSQDACNTCKDCHQFEVGTHPDIITLETTKIEEVREKVVREINIKPYQSQHKIIFIPQADTLNIQSQNALLKTIEEPPSYATIILMTANVELLLPTIRSRCLIIRFNDLSDTEMKNYFSAINYNKDKEEIYIRFSSGSIGTAQKLINDESFLTLRDESINYLNRLETADMIALYKIADELVEDKLRLVEILNFWELWYRDIMIYKTNNQAILYYPDYEGLLIDICNKLTYNKISMNLKVIQKSRIDISNNVYAMFVVENLLLDLKEKK
ncbi:MAG: hypothetical protein ATN35_07125 [Epulopiscium sp. Nele67-Bin004]|nr:MAG: hypothetical protein ATN35_07125 [Epulopiscium sp. Nele67-Bin004]